MSERGKPIGADADLTAEQRGPCYEAWTKYRDESEALGECADIADFRAGFIYGHEADLPNAFVKSLDERFPTSGNPTTTAPMTEEPKSGE